MVELAQPFTESGTGISVVRRRAPAVFPAAAEHIQGRGSSRRLTSASGGDIPNLRRDPIRVTGPCRGVANSRIQCRHDACPAGQLRQIAFQLGKRCIVQPFDATPQAVRSRSPGSASLAQSGFDTSQGAGRVGSLPPGARHRARAPPRPLRCGYVDNLVSGQRSAPRRLVGPSIVARYRPARRVVAAGYMSNSPTCQRRGAIVAVRGEPPERLTRVGRDRGRSSTAPLGVSTRVIGAAGVNAGDRQAAAP